MAAHILQVAYYPTLQETRTQMLKSAGYQVTSVLGNDNAIGLDGAVIAAADLIVVGFSASHSVRAAMVHNGALRGVPAGIRPGRIQDVAGQAVPMDPGAQQVIFFVAELTFSDGKRWTAKEKDVQIQRD